jgi:hypothetical protein
MPTSKFSKNIPILLAEELPRPPVGVGTEESGTSGVASPVLDDPIHPYMSFET